MSKKYYNKEEQKLLMKNPNIDKCTEKSISYSGKFKLIAIKAYRSGMSSRDVFLQGKLSLDLVGKDNAYHSLNRWRKVYKELGEEGLLYERRGRGKGRAKGRPKVKFGSNEEKIDALERKIAYLTAENDFLMKLRAKRAE